jgi:hypothetical protein
MYSMISLITESHTCGDRTPTASVYLTRLSYLWNAMELESGCEKKRLAVLR